MLLAPMFKPLLLEHGPMLAFRVVDAVIVLPHPIVVAKTGAGRRARLEPRMVARRRIA